MFKVFKRKDKRTELEKEIDSVLEEMRYQTKDSEEYAKNVQTVRVLMEAKTRESTQKISPDTKAYVITSFGTILLVLIFEMQDHIRSKAFPFIPKGRV